MLDAHSLSLSAVAELLVNCLADTRQCQLHIEHQVRTVDDQNEQDIITQQLSEALVERRFTLGTAHLLTRQPRQSKEFLLVRRQ